MFLYAWDHFREGQALEVAATEGPEVLDLFAEVLIKGVRRLLRRGLDRGYLEAREETPAPRGRIVLTETLKRASLVHGRAVCAYDELSTDVPHNRVLNVNRLGNGVHPRFWCRSVNEKRPTGSPRGRRSAAPPRLPPQGQQDGSNRRPTFMRSCPPQAYL